jgi:DNA-binding MarR family transcriptional regulator
LSQQALAGLLGVLPSRVVALVDELEQRGLVQRTRSTGDRRTNVLELTPAGTSALRTLASVGKAHEAEICTGLSEKEHTQLAALLGRLAVSAGLTPGVHPGYRGIA